MLSITRTVRIEWGDCDPAGIVYFPRYFEIFDALTAALIERAMGMTKIQAQNVYDFVGYPMVDVRARFLAPSRYGDDVFIETGVGAVKRSSFEIVHRLHNNGALAVEGTEKRVWVGKDPDNPDKIKSKPIPDEVAVRMRGE
jgi:4-hydroxybenzoyl-CoA thioesterase